MTGWCNKEGPKIAAHLRPAHMFIQPCMKPGHHLLTVVKFTRTITTAKLFTNFSACLVCKFLFPYFLFHQLMNAHISRVLIVQCITSSFIDLFCLNFVHHIFLSSQGEHGLGKFLESVKENEMVFVVTHDEPAR